MSRTHVALPGALLLFLAGCTDGELPTGLALERPAFATAAVGCDTDPEARVAALIQAIEAANANPGADVIDLAAGCTYTLTAVNNGSSASENNGLPVVTGELTIRGNGATIERSAEETTPDFRILDIAAGAAVSITDLAIAGGRTAGNGAGIRNRGSVLTITNSIIAGNRADRSVGASGGGVRSEGGGTMTVLNSVITDNVAVRSGGGISLHGVTTTLRYTIVSGNGSIATGTGGSGGGIHGENDHGSPGTALTLEHSTVSNNTAMWFGGGLDIRSGITLTLIHSTVSGNAAGDDVNGTGGGIRVINSHPLTILHTTVSGNSAPVGGGIYRLGSISTTEIAHSTIAGNSAQAGGGIHTVSGTVTLRNTIVASSSGGDCTRESAATLIDEGYNLVGDGSCISAGTSRSGAASLGPLADNGGPTKTHALLPGSQAINAGDPAFNDPALPFDQRGSGFARVQHGRLDIGAVEFACLAGHDYDAAAGECVSSSGYTFGGFLAPVSGTSVNAVKAGQAVPVKFSLGGDHGLAIFAAGSPSAPAVPCNAGDPTDEVTQVVSAGGSSLSYDASTGVYTYVWKTDKGWANTCRRLTLSFTDGSTHTANFRFTR